MKIITMIIIFLFYSQILCQNSAKEIINSTTISFEENKIDTLFGELLPKTTEYDTYKYLDTEKKRAETRPKIKEFLMQHWDGAEWDNFRRELYTYNLEGRFMTFLSQRYKNDMWVNESISIYKYLGDLRTEALFQKWINSKWENDKKYEFKYDANNQLIEWLEVWYRESKWNNKYKRTYSYNSNDGLNVSLLQTWNPSFGWVDIKKYTCQYDVNNILIEVIKWFNYAGSLNKSYRWRYTYDLEGNLLSEELRQWKNHKWTEDLLTELYYSKEIYLSERNDWKESGGFQGYDSLKFGPYPIHYQYIGTNEISEIGCTQIACENMNGKDFGHYLWLGDDYLNGEERYRFKFDWLSYGKVPFDFKRTIDQDFKTTIHCGKWDIFENPSIPKLNSVKIYNYDEKGNCIEYIKRNAKRVNINRNSMEYNEKNNLVYRLDQVWNIIEWKNRNRYFFTFTPIVDVSAHMDKEIDFGLENNYPNPFNPNTTIEYSLSSSSFVKLDVFDVLGRKIKTIINKEQPQGNYNVEFDASELSSGIYIYRLKAGDFVDAKKMTLMK